MNFQPFYVKGPPRPLLWAGGIPNWDHTPHLHVTARSPY